MFNTALLITAGAIALIGHTAFVSGLLLSLKNRRRRSHYREREAVEIMASGAALMIVAALLGMAALGYN